MLKEQDVAMLISSFQVVLAMPIKRSTFRQLQNAIMQSVGNNTETANKVLDSLLAGQVKSKIAQGSAEEPFKQFIMAFSLPVSLAKEVFEKGEFLNIIASDKLPNDGPFILSNTIRRVDGVEFHFMTDLESSVQLLQHLISRISEAGKKGELQEHKKALTQVRSSLKEILS